ncbi:hypothetical protein SAMN05444920_104114 [Nonomuraea solani]|uniref:Uncharacterized protein n=1 Tax=Nonomuraea solani TaxID=1144553 RepID=A0A1H6CLD0_9ACTN|nr:hypothetical protein [Nonomuraea solani]SEG73801.1 hypothetical protein SAMN05444920_104114 [Nonomuraea solani]
MDGESLAAAGLLTALSRAAGVLAELHHPFVRSTSFSYFIPPAGARTGTVFTLPDGREVTFAVSIVVAGDVFQVEGEVTAEDEVLLGLPRKIVPGIHDGLAALDDYAGEVAAAAGRLIDQQLDAIV